MTHNQLETYSYKCARCLAFIFPGLFAMWSFECALNKIIFNICGRAEACHCLCTLHIKRGSLHLVRVRLKTEFTPTSTFLCMLIELMFCLFVRQYEETHCSFLFPLPRCRYLLPRCSVCQTPVGAQASKLFENLTVAQRFVLYAYNCKFRWMIH